MRPETIEKYERVKAKRDQGMTFENALRSESMGSMSFYKVRDFKKETVAPKKERKPYTKKATFIDFHSDEKKISVEAPGRVAVIICDVSRLSEVLGGIK